jgi:hypothetical protein
MMAEAINQENDLLHKPRKISKLSRASNEVIIIPEMANAVICPDTGKSLKHHELIKKLKYKIKWIHTTFQFTKRT